MNEIENLISMLRRTYEKDAWHGPAVKEVLAGITQAMCFQRLPHTHSIIELVAHMTSWRNYTVEKLRGNDTFTVSDESNFPSATDWSAVVVSLEESQQRLLHALENFDVQKLQDIVPHNENRHTYYNLIHGIVHHDLYHTGQIMLIKKANTPQTM